STHSLSNTYINSFPTRRSSDLDVNVISSSEETAREVSVILDQNNLLNKAITKKHLFLMTGNIKNFTLIYENIFDNTLKSFSDVEIKQIKLKELEESYL